MSRITLEHVTLSRFGKVVLSDISLTLHDGQIAGLTGENGSGKTTLLDLVAGLLPLDSEQGQVRLASSSRLGYVRQRFDESVGHAFFDETLFLLEQRLRHLEKAMAAGDHSYSTLEQYDLALAEMDANDAYGLRHKLETFFRELGLDPSVWSRPLSTLSGGERMRIELATCLIREPDILLLDEPTNHLDLAGMRFLESWLKQYKGCCLFVSHDRAFMDAVATDILRLSGQSIEQVAGNYTHFKAVMDLRLGDLAERIRQEEKTLKRERAITQTMLSHRNISQYHNRKRRAAKMAASLSSLKSAAKNRDKSLGLRFDADTDEGNPNRIVLTIESLAGGYDHTLFKGFSTKLKASEKVALLGPNGCGKSTLFAILNKKMEPLAGSIRFAPGLKRASLAQHVRFTNNTRTVLSAVLQFSNDVSETVARSRLAQYGFDETDIKKQLHVLSGGEAARVALLGMLTEKPGFLLLDEPTNHLDIYTREILEKELALYPGTVLFISHDRYFLDAVADRILGFVGNKICEFDTYSDWLHAVTKAKANQKKSQQDENPKQQANTKSVSSMISMVDRSKAEIRRESARKRQTIADLEVEINKLETAIAEIEASLHADSGPDVYVTYAELTTRLEKASDDYLNLLD